MDWSKETPTEPGIYEYCDQAGAEPQLYLVRKTDYGLCAWLMLTNSEGPMASFSIKALVGGYWKRLPKSAPPEAPPEVKGKMYRIRTSILNAPTDMHWVYRVGDFAIGLNAKGTPYTADHFGYFDKKFTLEEA